MLEMLHWNNDMQYLVQISDMHAGKTNWLDILKRRLAKRFNPSMFHSVTYSFFNMEPLKEKSETEHVSSLL